MLELQPAFAGAVGHCLHAAVISVPCAIEHDAGEPGVLRLLRDELPYLGRLVALLSRQLVGGHGGERPARRIVHQLRVDVLERAEHHEPRTLRRAVHALPHAKVPAVTQLLPSLRPANLGHYLPPALPAFRRTCSPWYLTPLPLYGSGFRSWRISAAT